MKRIRIAIFLVLAVMLLCVLEHFLTENVTENLKSGIEQVTQSVKDEKFTESETKIETVYSDYKNYKKWMSMITSHDLLESAEHQIVTLRSHIKNKDTPNYLTHSEVLLLQLDEIKNMSAISIDNLL